MRKRPPDDAIVGAIGGPSLRHQWRAIFALSVVYLARSKRRVALLFEVLWQRKGVRCMRLLGARNNPAPQRAA